MSDSKQLCAFGESLSPCDASVASCMATNYQPQNNSSETVTVAGSNLFSRFPIRFDENTGACYEDTSLDMTSTGLSVRPEDNVYGDIVDDLKNISYSQSTGPGLDSVRSADLLAPNCRFLACDTVSTCFKGKCGEYRPVNGFCPSPSRSRVWLDNKNEANMPTGCDDLLENATLRTKSTAWPQTSMATTVSELARLPRKCSAELAAGLPTSGKFAASSCRQGQTGIRRELSQSLNTVADDEVHSTPAATPLLTPTGADLSKNFVPTLLRTAKSCNSQNRDVVAPKNVSELSRIGNGANMSTPFASSSPGR